VNLGFVPQVPHLGSNPLSVCGLSNASLLGFGDILCPGLLVAYCHYFDMKHKIRFRMYYVLEVICEYCSSKS
jgi:signal peptide peptidase-like protein 2B